MPRCTESEGNGNDKIKRINNSRYHECIQYQKEFDALFEGTDYDKDLQHLKKSQIVGKYPPSFRNIPDRAR